MTFPGLVLLLGMGWGVEHWRSSPPACRAGDLLAGVALLGWLPIARWQFDPVWQEVVGHGSYLKLGKLESAGMG